MPYSINVKVYLLTQVDKLASEFAKANPGYLYGPPVGCPLPGKLTKRLMETFPHKFRLSPSGKTVSLGRLHLGYAASRLIVRTRTEVRATW